jgi:NO-binding membrane sensor protein with MHYT domain
MPLDVAWSPYQIAISFLLAFIGAYNAVCLSEQFRMSHKLKPLYIGTEATLVVMSIAIGGGAIWCMHFVG